ncbi:MAG TPA: AraC family transcriptional regulator [Ferruginibacter sp.]|nr:AraC family transcriptional regulator [Ferruginibacter sp.]
MKQFIPINKLEDRNDFGLVVGHTSKPGAREALERLNIHRDDCYSFLLIETGEGSMTVDFIDIALPASHIYYLVPGQIHFNIKTNQGDAWYISVDTALIPKNLRDVFERNLLLQQPYKLDNDSFLQFQKNAHLLDELYGGDRTAPFYSMRIHSLLGSFLSMFAEAYMKADTTGKRSSRTYQITQEFKTLLTEKVKQEKSPSFYASQLNISETYLNEAVKGITGFTVTHWLMNEVIFEAKRLLIYSQLNVKEIADQLGYDDHTYFSRLFKKQSKYTPSGFREIYLK